MSIILLLLKQLTLLPYTLDNIDHAWGGNAFVWGGQVDGGKILGQYPVSFDNSDVSNIRGRLIPYRSWESIWYGKSVKGRQEDLQVEGFGQIFTISLYYYLNLSIPLRRCELVWYYR